MKTLYIHIGVGKTGTTFLQNILAQNFNLLSDCDLRYIQAGGGRFGAGHQQFAITFISDLPSYLQAPHNINETRAAIAKEISECPESNVLVSSENFAMANPLSVFEYAKTLSTVKEIKIILFARSQDELLESEYNQVVKVLAEARSIDAYFEESFYADFAILAEDWSRLFGRENIICRIYDGAKKSVISDFLSCLPLCAENIALDATKLDQGSNTALGYASLLIKKIINDRVHQNWEKYELLKLPEELKNLLDKHDIPAILFDSKKAARIRERYYSSNLEFTSKFFGTAKRELGGRRYSDYERDLLYEHCKKILSNLI